MVQVPSYHRNDAKAGTGGRAEAGSIRDGDPAGYAAAEAGFRQLSLPFWLAVTLLEHAELTGDEESLAEAREIFEDLKATPWLERAAGGSRLEPSPA